MLIGLDHVVIVVPDLGRAVAQYEELGFTVRPGGRHSTGTHNALIGLDDTSYIELLAFLTPNPDHRWAPMLEHGGGLVDICFSSDAIEDDRANFAAVGVPMEPPRAMSRTKPDGTEISWQLSVPLPPHAGAMPFLIEDFTPISARRPPAGPHANCIVGVRAIRWAAADPAAMAARFAQILGQPGEAFEMPALDAVGTRFAANGLHFEIIAPVDSKGPVAEWLATHATSPHSLVLERAGGAGESWQSAATGNVQFDIVPRG